MTPEKLLEKLQRYEAALQEIASRVEQQEALEEHQRRTGLPWESIDFGRLDTYGKIAHVAGEALRSCSQDREGDEAAVQAKG